jgi:hypothetical protein
VRHTILSCLPHLPFSNGVPGLIDQRLQFRCRPNRQITPFGRPPYCMTFASQPCIFTSPDPTRYPTHQFHSLPSDDSEASSTPFDPPGQHRYKHCYILYYPHAILPPQIQAFNSKPTNHNEATRHDATRRDTTRRNLQALTQIEIKSTADPIPFFNYVNDKSVLEISRPPKIVSRIIDRIILSTDTQEASMPLCHFEGPSFIVTISGM